MSTCVRGAVMSLCVLCSGGFGISNTEQVDCRSVSSGRVNFRSPSPPARSVLLAEKLSLRQAAAGSTALLCFVSCPLKTG